MIVGDNIEDISNVNKTLGTYLVVIKIVALPLYILLELEDKHQYLSKHLQ